MKKNPNSEEDLNNLEKQLEQKEKEFEDFLNKIKAGEFEIDEEKWEALKKEIGYKGIFDKEN
jgi:predicted  nucleic acid-binding Zn-ribbon protein